MKKPETIDITREQLQQLSVRLEQQLDKRDYEIVKAVLDAYVYLHTMLEKKTTSLKKLMRTVFGRTEKSKNVFKKSKESKGKKDDDGPPAANNVGDSLGEKEKPKGHGRNGHFAYTGAEKNHVKHPDFKHGDPCPECLRGRVYEIKEPGIIIRIKGAAPLQATAHVRNNMRCNTCGTVFKAPLPAEVGPEKYDETAGAMIALLRYGSGFPFKRLENLQAGFGVPLPASTQWEVAEQTADKIYPAYDELLRQSAQAEILHNDDTPMKVLELMQQNREEDQKKPSRTGIFTTGIVAKLAGRRIALFFTGRNHAGENMTKVLRKRSSGLPPPIQMCDALSRNTSKEFKSILANCMTHGRRNFVDVYLSFPEQCQYVLETLAEVYKNDAETRQKAMSANERLEYHEAHSGPLMNDLKQWLEEQLSEKKVEPNSGLGQAIGYMLNHWKALTQFLHVPGAPLDNNICERALKRAILHRKNSLFYKTQHGAYIGDLFMSLVHTCHLSKINPFDYLVSLQKYSSEVFKNPAAWLPWNYQDTMSALTAL